MKTSMNRCPAYTDPGTGPYETAHGASRSPSRRSPTSWIVRPAASSAAHRLPETTWLTSARTSQPSHGVVACQRSARIPATIMPVASSASACSSAMSVIMPPSSDESSQLLGLPRVTAHAEPVHGHHRLLPAADLDDLGAAMGKLAGLVWCLKASVLGLVHHRPPLGSYDR